MAALVAGYVLTLVLVLIAWAGLSLATGDARERVSDAAENVDIGGVGGAFSVVLRMVVHLFNMALGARFRVSLHGVNLDSADRSAHVSLAFPILLLTFAYLLLAYWAARIAGRVWGVGSRRGTAAMAFAGSLITATLATLLGRLCAYSASDEGVRVVGHSASVAGFFGALVLAFLGTWLGLNHACGRRVLGSHPLAREVVRATQTFIAHFLGLGLVVTLGATLYVFIKAWQNAGASRAFGTLLMLPLLVGHLMAWGFGQANFSQISASGQLGGLTRGVGEGVSMFTYPWWVVLLMIVACLTFIVAAGCVWALRRRVGRVSAQAEAFSWGVLPAIYLCGGLVLLVVARIGGSGSVFGDDGSARGGMSVHLAGWTPLLLALLGLLVDVAARYVAPLLLPSIPPAWRRLLAGRAEPVAPAAPAPAVTVNAGSAETLASPSAADSASANSVTTVLSPSATPSASTTAWPGLMDARSIEEESDTQTRIASGNDFSAWEADATHHAAPSQTAGSGVSASLTGSHSVESPAGVSGAGTSGAPGASGVGASSSASASAVGAAGDGMVGQPLSAAAKRRVRTVLIGLAALVGVLIALGILVGVLNSTVFTAKHKAQDVLAAVSSGDASKAVSEMGAAAPSGNQSLLTSGVYKQTRDRVTDYSITSVVPQGSTAAIHAKTKQDSGVGDMDMHLIKQGHRFGFFNNWVVSDMSLGHVQLQVPDGVSTLSVNGQSVDIGKLDADGDGVASLPAFPGTYTVKLPDQGKYLSGTQADVAAAWSDGGQPSKLTLAPNQQFTKDLAAAIKKKVDDCAAGAMGQTTYPSGCSWSGAYVPYDASNITWKVLSYPTVTLATTPNDDGSYSFQTNTQGSIQANWMSNDSSGSAAPGNATGSIPGDGKVSVNNDSLEVTFS